MFGLWIVPPVTGWKLDQLPSGVGVGPGGVSTVIPVPAAVEDVRLDVVQSVPLAALSMTADVYVQGEA